MYKCNSGSQEDLKEVLEYDPETGIFIAKTNRGYKYKKGDVLGVIQRQGYLQVCAPGFNAQGQRMAWFYMEGYWPEHHVDHINRIKDDNRWCNLRHVTRSCNFFNRPAQRNNTSGVTGVYYNKQTNKWYPQIRVNHHMVTGGFFDEFKDAVIGRYKLELENHFDTCNEKSDSYLYLLKNNLLDP